MPAIISIHDVMPATLAKTQYIIDRLSPGCRTNLLLLVVPGQPWTTTGIAQLRRWEHEGLILTGHGWTHAARDINGWYHRLHSLLVSRRAAEHLSLTEQEIEALMCRNSDWFAEHGLRVPDYYVPPAWALGRVNGIALARTPFKYLETTSGIVNLATSEKRRLPLVGFEADTVSRQFALGAFNKLNEMASVKRRPLRIAIHPFDFDYRLASQLSHVLERVTETVHYRTLFDAVPG